jgi:hypothetical protein
MHQQWQGKLIRGKYKEERSPHPMTLLLLTVMAKMTTAMTIVPTSCRHTAKVMINLMPPPATEMIIEWM